MSLAAEMNQISSDTVEENNSYKNTICSCYLTFYDELSGSLFLVKTAKIWWKLTNIYLQLNNKYEKQSFSFETVKLALNIK